MSESIEELRARVEKQRRIEQLQDTRPILFYRAHEHGQLQFHQAQHIIRAMWPGNGFGKTRAMGSEFAWWVYKSHPYQRVPKWPLITIWCAETYKQFEILREQLQSECLGPERSLRWPAGWKFNKSDRCYAWPDGTKMFLVSGDSSWTHIQGINPDLVGFDEEPPYALWNEFRMRRRGKRKTRFCFAATATQGMTWMYHQLYTPWLKLHADAGITELAAMKKQQHPFIWAWSTGGIDDNPGADDTDRAYYHAQDFSSDAERTVRLRGGFQDFSGQPVFDLKALELLEADKLEGEHGTLTPRLNDAGKPIPGKVTWTPDGKDEAGRITIFEHPQLDQAKYVLGFDSAYGLRTGDFDYAVVLDRNTGRQVAEAQGHWGDVRWAMTLAALHYYYGGAFIVGERQVGLITMRRLYDEFGIAYQFHDRDEAKRARRKSDTLGHHRREGDLVVRKLRKAIGGHDMAGRPLPPEVRPRSSELIRQLKKYSFLARKEGVDPFNAGDADLKMGAPPGDHDDGVMALVYANLGLQEVERFEDEAPKYEEGTFGHVFKMDQVLKPKQHDPLQSRDPFRVDDED